MRSRGWPVFIILLLLTFSGLPAGHHEPYPLPEDRGTAGALAALEKLPVYARVLHIVAHPDDESAATLTWLSRKFHAQTALFCLTRGEGGQNVLGNEKYEALGLVRTGELLEACRFYGAELYFGKAVDFGFSKTAEETLSKWGHEAMLEDVTGFIRRWRPDIIISRFQGKPMDGHGHHQAVGLLAREAYRAAADPGRFPEQTRNGLPPWQAKKFYVSHFGGEPAPALAGADGSPGNWTVRVPVGDFDPVLGRSCKEIATEGYARHRSQGSGTAYSLPSRSYEYFSLVDSPAATMSREESFFDSLDTSLMAIPDLAGSERQAAASIRENLAAAQRAASEALRAFQVAHPEISARPVAEGIEALNRAIRGVESSTLSKPAKLMIADALRLKLADFQKALNAVLGICIVARSNDVTGVPGEKAQVTVHFFNRGPETVLLKDIALRAPGPVAAADNKPFSEQPPGSTTAFRYSVSLAADAAETQPFWYVEKSGAARYRIRPTDDEFAPFGKPEIMVEAVYRYGNTEVPVQAAARAQAGDPLRGPDFPEFQIVPALSLTLDPQTVIAPSRLAARSCKFRVSVLNNLRGETRGTLRLVAAKGWIVKPPQVPFRISRKGEAFAQNFEVRIPGGAKTGEYPVEAVAAMDGQEFRRGYQTISYPENWTRNLYAPARSLVEIFKVNVAPNLTAGYIPGAGDEIPAALEQLGVKVQTLSAADLAFGDLSRFQAIIMGIRAYNVNEDLRANNRRLLDYVQQGGTLIVQYVRPMERPRSGASGSPFAFGPYPMSVSDGDRITVEDSPLRILDPQNPVFTRPNTISPADFEGWVQERGLYFMSTWDSRYKPLLSGNDPGEEAKNGGMLYARYGKGHYIYTGYSWFRQLPAGNPGAYRIFANMISLGRFEARK